MAPDCMLAGSVDHTCITDYVRLIFGLDGEERAGCFA